MNKFVFKNQDLEIKVIDYIISIIGGYVTIDGEKFNIVTKDVYDLEWTHIDQFIEPYTYSFNVYRQISGQWRVLNTSIMDTGEIFNFYENLITSENREELINEILN
jgi:hypothetical protein